MTPGRTPAARARGLLLVALVSLSGCGDSEPEFEFEGKVGRRVEALTGPGSGKYLNCLVEHHMRFRECEELAKALSAR